MAMIELVWFEPAPVSFLISIGYVRNSWIGVKSLIPARLMEAARILYSVALFRCLIKYVVPDDGRVGALFNDILKENKVKDSPSPVGQSSTRADFQLPSRSRTATGMISKR